MHRGVFIFSLWEKNCLIVNKGYMVENQDIFCKPVCVCVAQVVNLLCILKDVAIYKLCTNSTTNSHTVKGKKIDN